MGAVLLTFAVYTTPDGRLVVDPYDRIAKVMGVPTDSFTVRHKDKVTEIKRLLMAYVKDLRQMNVNHQTNHVKETAGDCEVKLSDSGYPLLPSNVRFRDRRKAELDGIVRTYLACHYSERTILKLIYIHLIIH